MISYIANKKPLFLWVHGFHSEESSPAVTAPLPRLEIAQDQRAVDPGESMGTLGFWGFSKWNICLIRQS